MASADQPSQKQKNILLFIWEHLNEYDRPPAYREIGQVIGTDHVGVVSHHVGRLEKMGFLRREGGVARGLSLTEKALVLLDKVADSVQEALDFVQIRIVGDIVAGQPVASGNGSFDNYDHDETILVKAGLLPRQQDDVKALRVRGWSMVDALVNDGDIVVLQKVHDVRDGDMVAVWLDHRDEMTLKYIYREGKMTRLQPANPDEEPILVPSATVNVQGKVIMIQRNLYKRGPARRLS